jgi:hypothetical protein
VTVATELFLDVRFRVPLAGGMPVGVDGVGRPRTALLNGKAFFNPRHVVRRAVPEERKLDGVSVKAERLRGVAFLLPEEAAAVDPGDFISFPTNEPTTPERLSRLLNQSPGFVCDLSPVRVDEVSDETYTHPENHPFSSTRLVEGETYVKVFVKPAGPLKPAEAKELGAWME